MTASRPTHRKQKSSRWNYSAPFDLFSRRHEKRGSRNIEANITPEEPRHELPNYKNYKHNAITTTKYSLWNFVFLNIWHQLTNKYATVYFIFIAVLNFCPEFASYQKFLGLIPVVFVMGTTMLKDLFEDLRRWRSDIEINKRTCKVFDIERNAFRKIFWQSLIVGDIVKIGNNQDIPADLLLLRSSDKSGTCFVETSNLDGETSLKQCFVPSRYLPLSENIADPDTLGNPNFDLNSLGKFHFETPVKTIESVTATIDFGNGVEDVIERGNMLLRGSKLKNTAFIQGIVMYAGHDTKVMLNNGRAPLKVSSIERKTNWFIVICLVIMIGMITANCILCGKFLASNEDPDSPFIPPDSPSPGKAAALGIGIYCLLYQFMVPISLYITVEMIKLFQVYFISQDLDMYDEEKDFPADCRSLNIPEELGQITHVLSDKTGTLTENNMIFRNCALDEEDHSCDPENSTEDVPILSKKLVNRAKKYKKDKSVMHFFKNILVNNTVVVNKGMVPAERKETLLQIPAPSAQRQVSFVIEGPMGEEVLASEEPEVPMRNTGWNQLKKFIRGVYKDAKEAIIDHLKPGNRFSIEVEEKAAGMENDNVKFHAESPDELALINGAELYGFSLEERSTGSVLIKNPDGTPERVVIRLILPFDSRRKRMSVVVEEGSKIIMYTKGADSAVLEKLAESSESMKTTLSDHLNDYAVRGLRTLCFAMKELTTEQFTALTASYKQVMQDRTKERNTMLSDLAESYETEMTLIGVTGIEDKLQEGVDSTIRSLRKAKIQIWVLTGDKLETAENIARSSGLFDDDTPIFRIKTSEDIHHINEPRYNIVLSTDVLELVNLGDPLLIKLLSNSSCVLCYRMTPAEKATVVKAVMKYLKGKVLAIGDGANDVPMIQAAHVGIGVKGKEGTQAVMGSDYAIGRFRFLQKLLLVHGHWCYERLAKSFLYFLYKNTNSCAILFFFQFFSGNSGSFFIDPTYGILYPIVFTSLQPILVGVLDQDYPQHELMFNSAHYRTGMTGSSYTFLLFFFNVLDGLWQAAVIYFVPQLALWETDAGLWTLGLYAATGMMFANCAHLAIEVRYWTSWISGCFAFFFGAHFAFFTAYYSIAQPGWIPDLPINVLSDAYSTMNFWCSMFIILIVSVAPRFLLRIAENSDLFSTPE